MATPQHTAPLSERVWKEAGAALGGWDEGQKGGEGEEEDEEDGGG